jgi:DNA-binding NtrC family response regulator
MKKFRILIVDDDNNLAVMLEARLKTEDYQVRIANSAEAAYQMFFAFWPHLVLTDIGIGEENGLDLIKRIRRQIGRIKTVYMTGDAARYRPALAQEQKLYHAAILEKPFKYNELVSVVSAQVRGQQEAA